MGPVITWGITLDSIGFGKSILSVIAKLAEAPSRSCELLSRDLLCSALAGRIALLSCRHEHGPTSWFLPEALVARQTLLNTESSTLRPRGYHPLYALLTTLCPFLLPPPTRMAETNRILVRCTRPSYRIKVS